MSVVATEIMFFNMLISFLRSSLRMIKLVTFYTFFWNDMNSFKLSKKNMRIKFKLPMVSLNTKNCAYET